MISKKMTRRQAGGIAVGGLISAKCSVAGGSVNAPETASKNSSHVTAAGKHSSTNSTSYHEILVLDAETDRPIPLVKLQTTSGLAWFTDNAGVVCLDSPELVGQEVWLSVSSHGYVRDADGFGMRGIRVKVQSGGETRLSLKRTMKAERVGRLTGSGMLAESQKLGRYQEYKESGVVGCDSTFLTRWKGKLFWLWGDTNLFGYPLGIYRTLGATTSLDSSDALDYETQPLLPAWLHFRSTDGKLRPIAEIENEGPVWLGGLISLPDREGKDHLVASYVKIRGKLEAIESGLCEWDDDAQVFRVVRKLWGQTKSENRRPESMLIPDGHPVRYKDSLGKEQLLFVNPFPQVQVAANYESWLDPTTWIRPSLDFQKPWENGKFHKLDGEKKLEVVPHRGDMVWSERLSKWITVFTQIGGDASYLGEVWYAESDTPLGPWSDPIQIVTHDNYTFYNPVIHKHALSKESPYLYFEGTYTAEFANRAEKTPRYDYNQVLYRLNLDAVRVW